MSWRPTGTWWTAAARDLRDAFALVSGVITEVGAVGMTVGSA